MIKNKLFYIATCSSVKTKILENKLITWNDLLAKLLKENKTSETYQEYMSMDKLGRLNAKDVGGYIAGFLRDGKRSVENIEFRSILTFDIDRPNMNFWEDFKIQFENEAVLHQTHSYSKNNERFRLVIPLSRTVTPEEYIIVSKKIADLVDRDAFDNSTFEPNRIMFWPSNPCDIDYYCEHQVGEFLDPDMFLGMSVPDNMVIIDNNIKQEDPTTKEGVVGFFCKTYSISDAIEIFLSDVYEKAFDKRYTYKKGSSHAGLITYEDKFAYSHHESDPAFGKLCNSFDLVRLHRFKNLDFNSESELNSFNAMIDFALQDSNVKKFMAKEAFSKNLGTTIDIEYDEVEDNEWTEKLEVDRRGKYLSSSTNINLILENDYRFKNTFYYNEFDSKKYVFRNLPWRKIINPDPIKNVDYSGIRNYIECTYGIVGVNKIEDSLSLQFEKNSYHPIKNYLNSLIWDRENRIDYILIDYFGAEDNIYTKEAVRKILVAAVARIFEPGIKFDLVLTLVGKQGTGKSTLIKKLGKGWSSDTFFTVNGKDAFEQLQGAWLIEIAELAGLKSAEVESIKHFISKQEDTFRPAYARMPETYKRQCVFFGTTNNSNFLRDQTGNRRFMPIDVNEYAIKKSIFNIEEAIVDQIWAEAVYRYRNGEKLFLSNEANNLAKIEQLEHTIVDERTGLIEDYLNTKLPINWEELDIYQRRDYLLENNSVKGVIERTTVCVAEIWCECLGKEKKEMDRYKTRDINDIMKNFEDWEKMKSTKNFKNYGKQKYYARKLY